MDNPSRLDGGAGVAKPRNTFARILRGNRGEDECACKAGWMGRTFVTPQCDGAGVSPAQRRILWKTMPPQFSWLLYNPIHHVLHSMLLNKCVPWNYPTHHVLHSMLLNKYVPCSVRTTRVPFQCRASKSWESPLWLPLVSPGILWAFLASPGMLWASSGPPLVSPRHAFGLSWPSLGCSWVSPEPLVSP